MTWSRRRPARTARVGMRVATVATAALAVTTTAGCSFFVPPAASTPSTAAAATDGPTGSGLTPSGSPTGSGTPPSSAPAAGSATTAGATPSPADTNVAMLQGGTGASKVLVLPDSGAPAGYQGIAARDTGSFRMNVCGVDLEPNAPVDGAQKRWENGNAYLEEHVRTYSDRTSSQVVAALRAAIPRCTTYTNGANTYTVEKLALPAEAKNSVGWRQRLSLPAQTPPASTAAPTTPAATPVAHTLIQDVAVSTIGSSSVLLISYSVDTAPQPQVLTRPLQALYALGARR